MQGRGKLRRELARCLRSGRTTRKRRGTTDGRGRIPGMVLLSERPAEADDRAVRGHWEVDLLLGEGSRSAVGTLVGRSTRMTLLLHLPDGKSAEQVEAAMRKAITSLPSSLARTITWDQGAEMSKHAKFTMATGIPVYFCDPHSPWQRGSNENTCWYKMAGPEAPSTGVALVRAVGGRSRTRADRLSVELSTAARWARAPTRSDLDRSLLSRQLAIGVFLGQGSRPPCTPTRRHGHTTSPGANGPLYIEASTGSCVSTCPRAATRAPSAARSLRRSRTASMGRPRKPLGYLDHQRRVRELLAPTA